MLLLSKTGIGEDQKKGPERAIEIGEQGFVIRKAGITFGDGGFALGEVVFGFGAGGLCPEQEDWGRRRRNVFGKGRLNPEQDDRVRRRMIESGTSTGSVRGAGI